MKKTTKALCILFAALLAATLFTTFLSCSTTASSYTGTTTLANKSYGWGSYTFNKCHITTKNADVCVSVKKWYESETGVEIETTGGDHYWLSEGTYILIGSTCPICSAKTTNTGTN